MQRWTDAHGAELVDVKLTTAIEQCPAAALGFATKDVIACFSFWESAQADFDVMDIATNQWLAHETAITVDDETFELEFFRFLAIAGFAPG